MQNEILLELKEIRKLLMLQKSMLNLNEFCSYTGFSKDYAYQLTSAGKIRFYRPNGKVIFFSIEDILQFLKQNPVETKKDMGLRITNYQFRSKYKLR